MPNGEYHPHCAGCRCFDRVVATPPCNHCYCVPDSYGGTGTLPPHVRCCKCGDRIAQPGNFTISVTNT